MTRYRALIGVIAGVMLGVLATTASAQTHFRPRVGGAMGLIPPVNKEGVAFDPDIASGTPTQVTYHGGAVMNPPGGVTVHTIFWTGSAADSKPFPDSPQLGAPSYEGLITGMFDDVASDSTGTSGAGGTCGTTGPADPSNCNVFTVLPGFGSGRTASNTGPGNYTVNYDDGVADDNIVDTDPYPDPSVQCNSPQATEVCITDGQVQQEIDSIAPPDERGLSNFWFVFLPPGVDECISPGVCGTNAFGAYHSAFNINGDGVTIYAVAIDPIIEVGPISPGADPNGNPDAESTADAAAHETVEAMTDPQGVGWMDPNGFEVADKCEFGSQFGTPLGTDGPDNAEYNQDINGDHYLIQDMWSNNVNGGLGGCVQGTTDATVPLPLPQVNLTQFSGTVSGATEPNATPSGTGTVQVSLIRSSDSDGDPVTVAQASSTIGANADGTWSVNLPQHLVGDDRDEIDIDYSGSGAPAPNHEVILTGNGGNPFTESGWTGWTAMDNGVAVTGDDPNFADDSSVTMSPCFQVGVLAVTIDASPLADSPTDFCSTQTGAAAVDAGGTLDTSDVVTTSSNDNRGFAPPDATDAEPPGVTDVPNPNGVLVNMTVPAGEPDAVSSFNSPMAPFFEPTGFPTCTADLEMQTVSCSGLVSGQAYSLHDGSQQIAATADDNGDISKPVTLAEGDTVNLSNGSRNVTSLDVAHLQAQITGEQSVLSGGTCQGGQYYGAAPTDAPTNDSAGDFGDGGGALTGQVCPTSGDATGLSTDSISQTDEASGGSTQTEVPDVTDTSPMQGETVDGPFVAIAESGLPGSNNSVTPTDSTSKIALSIAKASGGAAVFTATNVDTATGEAVTTLAPGTYKAAWTLTDANGDTRTVTTRFVELPANQGPKGDQGPQGQQGPKGNTGPRGPRGPAGPKPRVSCHLTKHHKVSCKVSFPKSKHTSGDVRMALARGSKVVALGHGAVKRGHGTITLRGLGRISRGRWTATIVLSRHGKATRTTWMTVRVR
jgi:hypothetical protein